MTVRQLMLPANRAFNSNGIPAASGTASLYYSGTSTPALFYADEGLTQSMGSVITANAAGRFTPMPYGDDAVAYRLVIKDKLGATLDDIDPFYFGGDAIDIIPTRLTYGIRNPIRTLREAREWMSGLNGRTALHLQIPGYAAHPNSTGTGVTGGYGKTEYYVDKPESMAKSITGTMGWALDQATTNGGGLIYIDPRGEHDLVITDATSFKIADGQDNITIYAPGKNFTVWCDSLNGSVVVQGANLIFWGVSFRTLSGAMSGDFAGAGIKSEIGLVACSPQYMDKVAFVECEFRHASDGACDIASSSFTAASAECNVTFHNCIFWDTDEAQLCGSISDTTLSTDARKLFVTHSNTIWAYCGQRLPKSLGLAMVHMVNCYSIIKPWYRDQPSPVISPGACAGAAVQGGGWLLAEGCLWQAGDDIGGYPATNLVAGTNGETGYLNITGCIAENDCTFTTNGVVAAPSYSLPYTPIPASGTLREDWIADRWSTAGARPDAAPAGMFRWVSDSTEDANGETVLIERGKTGRWIRADARIEYPPTPSPLINIQQLTTAANITPYFLNSQINVTALATATSFTNPKGVAIDGTVMSIRIKDNGTAHSIGWGSQYRAIGVTIPTATVPNKTMYITLVWNAADTTFDVVSVITQA